MGRRSSERKSEGKRERARECVRKNELERVMHTTTKESVCAQERARDSNAHNLSKKERRSNGNSNRGSDSARVQEGVGGQEGGNAHVCVHVCACACAWEHEGARGREFARARTSV